MTLEELIAVVVAVEPNFTLTTLNIGGLGIEYEARAFRLSGAQGHRNWVALAKTPTEAVAKLLAYFKQDDPTD